MAAVLSSFTGKGIVMLTAIKGYYENGKIILTEQPPVSEKTEVVVTFLGSGKESVEEPIQNVRKLGGFKGQLTLPDDFNEHSNLYNSRNYSVE